jgi:dTDP-4-amino-4,6-dideoxygalactose transaminase
MRLRHLPPTAVPLTIADLRQGLHADSQATARFQAALCRYLGTQTCLVAASGRTVLYLLLKQLAATADSPSRQEVILPAYTCPALAKVILDLGLQPCPIDISSQTLALDGRQLADHLSQRTLAVICVHPFGIPQAVAEIRTLAHSVGAVVIEDAAQSMGAKLDGQPVGTQGDFGLFSLGPGKPLATGGGGILSTDDERYSRLLSQLWESLPPLTAVTAAYKGLRLALLSLAFHPTGWWLATRAGLHRIGAHQASWGYKLSRLSQVQAHVGLALLPRLNEVNQHRRAHAHQIQECLQGIDFVHIPSPAATAEPIYLRLPILVDSETRRERLFHRLWTAGIGVGRMYEQTLPQIFPQLATRHYPGADQVAHHLLTLPTHHYLTDADVACIAQIFASEV